jgi:hypothetical protein
MSIRILVSTIEHIDYIDAIERVFDSTAIAGINLNRTIENATMGIAGFISANTELEGVLPFEKFNIAVGKTEDLIRDIKLASIDTGVSLSDLTDVFQKTVGVSLSAGDAMGQSLDEVTKNTLELTKRATNIADTINVPIEEVTREIRNILEGTITPRSSFAYMMGITNEEIEKAKETAGGLADYLNEKFGAFDPLFNQKTFDIAVAGIVANLDLIKSEASKPIFDDLITQLVDVNEFLTDNKDSLISTFRGGYEAIKESSDEVLTLAVGLVAYKTATLAIIPAMTTLRTMAISTFGALITYSGTSRLAMLRLRTSLVATTIATRTLSISLNFLKSNWLVMAITGVTVAWMEWDNILNKITGRLGDIENFSQAELRDKIIDIKESIAELEREKEESKGSFFFGWDTRDEGDLRKLRQQLTILKKEFGEDFDFDGASVLGVGGIEEKLIALVKDHDNGFINTSKYHSELAKATIELDKLTKLSYANFFMKEYKTVEAIAADLKIIQEANLSDSEREKYIKFFEQKKKLLEDDSSLEEAIKKSSLTSTESLISSITSQYDSYFLTKEEMETNSYNATKKRIEDEIKDDEEKNELLRKAKDIHNKNLEKIAKEKEEKKKRNAEESIREKESLYNKAQDLELSFYEKSGDYSSAWQAKEAQLWREYGELVTDGFMSLDKAQFLIEFERQNYFSSKNVFDSWDTTFKDIHKSLEDNFLKLLNGDFDSGFDSIFDDIKDDIKKSLASGFADIVIGSSSSNTTGSLYSLITGSVDTTDLISKGFSLDKSGNYVKDDVVISQSGQVLSGESSLQGSGLTDILGYTKSAYSIVTDGITKTVMDYGAAIDEGLSYFGVKSGVGKGFTSGMTGQVYVAPSSQEQVAYTAGQYAGVAAGAVGGGYLGYKAGEAISPNSYLKYGTAATGALAGGAYMAGVTGLTAGLSAVPVYGWVAAAVLTAVTSLFGDKRKVQEGFTFDSSIKGYLGDDEGENAGLYEWYKKKQWGSNKSSFVFKDIDEDAQNYLMGLFSFYENTLQSVDKTKHIFLDFNQQVSAHKNGLTADKLEETLFSNFVSQLTGLDFDSAKVEEIKEVWLDRAENLDKDLMEVITESFSEVAKVRDSFKALALDQKGLDGSSIIEMQNSISALDSARVTLSNSLKNIGLDSIDLNSITSANFIDMYDTILASNPTPAMLDNLNAFGNAMLSVANMAQQANNGLDSYLINSGQLNQKDVLENKFETSKDVILNSELFSDDLKQEISGMSHIEFLNYYGSNNKENFNALSIDQQSTMNGAVDNANNLYNFNQNNNASSSTSSNIVSKDSAIDDSLKDFESSLKSVSKVLVGVFGDSLNNSIFTKDKSVNAFDYLEQKGISTEKVNDISSIELLTGATKGVTTVSVENFVSSLQTKIESELRDGLSLEDALEDGVITLDELSKTSSLTAENIGDFNSALELAVDSIQDFTQWKSSFEDGVNEFKLEQSNLVNLGFDGLEWDKNSAIRFGKTADTDYWSEKLIKLVEESVGTESYEETKKYAEGVWNALKDGKKYLENFNENLSNTNQSLLNSKIDFSQSLQNDTLFMGNYGVSKESLGNLASGKTLEYIREEYNNYVNKLADLNDEDSVVSHLKSLNYTDNEIDMLYRNEVGDIDIAKVKQDLLADKQAILSYQADVINQDTETAKNLADTNKSILNGIMDFQKSMFSDSLFVGNYQLKKDDLEKNVTGMSIFDLSKKYSSTMSSIIDTDDPATLIKHLKNLNYNDTIINSLYQNDDGSYDVSAMKNDLKADYEAIYSYQADIIKQNTEALENLKTSFDDYVDDMYLSDLSPLKDSQKLQKSDEMFNESAKEINQMISDGASLSDVQEKWQELLDINQTSLGLAKETTSLGGYGTLFNSNMGTLNNTEDLIESTYGVSIDNINTDSSGMTNTSVDNVDEYRATDYPTARSNETGNSSGDSSEVNKLTEAIGKLAQKIESLDELEVLVELTQNARVLGLELERVKSVAGSAVGANYAR